MQVTRSMDEDWQITAEPVCARAIETGNIRKAAANLRRQVSLMVGNSPAISDHLAWLSNHGFSGEDSRRIRCITEIFYNCEPILSIAYALSMPRKITAEAQGALTRPEAGFWSSNQSRHTGAHAFFKALSAWPGYGEMATRELSQWDPLPELVKATAEDARSSAAIISGNLDQPLGELREKLIVSCEVLVITCGLRQMFINAEATRRSG